MMSRYVLRCDPDGFAVCDSWTGQTVMLANVPQRGLSHEEAAQTAAMLNLRAARTILQ